MNPVANILIVDDTPANLQLLTGMLKDRGYRVRPVTSGELALRAIRTQPPDLVLLDITMPGMDGYELCRLLKADECWREIPVIFLSALSETEDKVRAFQAGGVDYIAKPFQLEEVEARVHTHLVLRRQQLELQRNYARLRELETLRDTLTHMVAHDMRSPLLALQMSLGMLADDLPGADTENAPLVDTARRSTAQLVEMVSQMLDVSRLESGKMPVVPATLPLAELVASAVDPLRPLAAGRRLEIDLRPDLQVTADRDLLRRVFGNLLGNAIKFTATDGRIAVSATQTEAGIRIAISDNGAGIPAEQLPQIFSKFGQARAADRRGGSGLGLAFAKMAVEAHGGTIGVESTEGAGSTFWFTLPNPPSPPTSAQGGHTID